MIFLTLLRGVQGQNNTGRNCTTQSKMCVGKESRGYLSVRLKKTLRVERGDDHKDSCGMNRFNRGIMTGRERSPWERGRRWEGGRGCHTIRSTTRTSLGRQGSCQLTMCASWTAICPDEDTELSRSSTRHLTVPQPFGDERGIVMLRISGLHWSQTLLVCRL
jgi:hypothetical protein